MVFLPLPRSEYRRSPGRSYGLDSENGSWNGIVGLIASDALDVGIGKFAMTSSRISHVSYLPVIFPAK
jgi:hypothetical protein